jgi:enoyl-CoA hydratase
MPAETPLTPRLDVTRDGPALVLAIANTGRANALDATILDGLAAAVGSPPPGVRAVVLTGAGDRHFSSGLDLSGVEGDALAARLRDGERRLQGAAAAVSACPVPVIAAINGAAFGGALELAMACDWRLASDGATFGMPAARLGVVYAPDGMRRFIACMGPARTRRMFLTGRPVDAATAYAWGLVDGLHPAAELLPAAVAAAHDVALAAPGAVAGTRAAVAALVGPLDVHAATVVEAARAEAYASPEFAEGLAAFRERRPPRWGDV